MSKEYFKNNKVAYTEYDVVADTSKRKEMIDLTGQMGVPVIVIDDQVIVGFNQKKLAQLLGL